MQSAYDRWLTSDRAYERYYRLDGDEEVDDSSEYEQTMGLLGRRKKAADAMSAYGREGPAVQAMELRHREDTMGDVSMQEARAHRIETALREIEQAADVGRFRPEVAAQCLGEIWYTVKQLRADVRRER